MGTFSNDLQIFDMLLGDSAGSGYADWGEATDDNFNKIEKALTATTDIAVTTANVTLSDTDIKCFRLNITGLKTGNRSIIFPTRKRWWFVRNGSGGNFTLTAKCSGQPGVTIRSGVDILFCDGTDIQSLTIASVNRIANTADLPTPPAGYVSIFAKDASGNIGTATINTTTGQVSSVTVFS